MRREIQRYLDEHGATYTTEALRRGLLDAGYGPVEVDRALAEWQEERSGGMPSAEARRRFRRWALLLHVGGLVFVLVVLLVVYRAPFEAVVSIAGVALAIALLIGWAISSAIGRMLLPSTGLLVALIAPAVSVILLGGTCLALATAAIGPPPRVGAVEVHLDEPAFDGVGAALCHGANGGYVSVFAEDVGMLDGRTVSASVNLYPSSAGPAPVEPGAEPPVDGPRSFDVGITLLGGGPGEAPGDFYGAAGGGEIEIDASGDGLSGTARFDRLARMPGDPTVDLGAGPESISGTLSWRCE
ncbi:MAG TPA: hypothetical protein VHK06_01425 [Candidatus Limnocylindria bacterium]|nr:hypothetical protein [Candidatus Limnocylindria bacterium]